jgi:hypothetical protein
MFAGSVALSVALESAGFRRDSAGDSLERFVTVVDYQTDVEFTACWPVCGPRAAASVRLIGDDRQLATDG